jgi:uncharacterized peroxidase-related enzyme
MPSQNLHVSVAESPLFADVTEAAVPAAARPVLEKVQEVFGFMPNLAVIMALEPAALESYFHALQAFGEMTLTPVEQQIVLMAVSRANAADYSLAIHAALAAKLGAAPDVVKAVGIGAPVMAPKLAALRHFAEVLTIERGQVSERQVDALLAAGYDRKTVIAVAFGVAVKTFANALAHLARTPVDAPFASALEELHE